MWALFMFVNGFISIAILTALAKLFDTPFIFPTLGAVAFLVFFTPTTAPASPRNALSGNAVAIACGYGALWVTALEHAGPATDANLGWARILAVSLALAASSAFMILLNVPHPPAAGTAMFVALGVVTKPAYLLVLEAAVALLVVQAIVINRLTGVRYPLWSHVPPPLIGKRAGRVAAHRVAGLLWRTVRESDTFDRP
jgi:CBS-domain-containing membrane protein